MEMHIAKGERAMSELITSVIQTQLDGKIAGMEKQQLQQSPKSGSFESVLQKTDPQTGPGINGQTANQINDPKMEAERQDLIRRYQELPEGMPKASALLPEYLNTKSTFQDFRNTLFNVVNSGNGLPKGSGILNEFSKTEQMWFRFDDVMKSGKDLSQAELLGLQAGLYQVSQHIEVLSKVVDQMTSGVKTILNTNL